MEFNLTFPLLLIIFFASFLFSFFIFSFLAASRFGEKTFDHICNGIEEQNVMEKLEN
ncbi:MAG: hypothetical protein JEY94_13260 [Melioribacteraceae bacterium]|nr:hypothetical protein [Melioribacteraceae bacterium]